MAVKWTEEQQKVIDLRNRTLLVSAAAGSGKTAVLVERILSMISDGEHPVDIDTLLIVTFTNAAASEMRERISAAIDKKIEEHPDNVHLQKQQTLIHTADITTIDSFCLKVLREHFAAIHLDPAFRIGDEGEQKLLKTDLLKSLLEEYYEEGRPEFYRFIESYTTGKTDAGLEELILKLYEFAMSYPNPNEWLSGCLSPYCVETPKELSMTPAFLFLMDYQRKLAQDCKERLYRAKKICMEKDGPYMYQEAIASDLPYLEQLVKADTYEGFGDILNSMEYMRLSPKKDAAVSEEKKVLVKNLRESVKEDLKDLKKQFYFQSAEAMLSDIRAVKERMEMLVELATVFLGRFQEKKREKNILDFSDIEHLALDILTSVDAEGNRVPTAVADEYSRHYTEVMIDEYQDSNLVQEFLLGSVSKTRFGEPNIFMVGDVKQSIYKFRLARPELFMEKYHNYTVEDSLYQRVDLHKNFRSREEVLTSVNDLFYRLMREELGNICYDEDAALDAGMEFPEDEESPMKNLEQERKTELILIEKEIEEAESSQEEINAVELEAKAIAQRIRQLTHENEGFRVWDKKTETYRTAEYRDIVILLRTVTGFGDSIVNVLMEEGIPAYSQSQRGYFTALEVQTVLNLCKVIDNPRQDIPLTGILRSPIGGLTTEELAWIKAASPETGMYEAVLAYLEQGGKAQEKLCTFMEKLTALRDMVPYTAIHDLLSIALDMTGYGEYVAAMPAGTKRRMNLDMLIEKAVAYEKTSYRGLFHFIRYIEKLQKYDVDFGEASFVGEQDNTVRIMSIHKSKGLEFPIVFVSGMGKRFNQMDAGEKVILHPDFGIGAEYVDYEKRIKAPTLIKRILQKSIRLENLGEELRILYVALTRAKEKLIMTGTVAKAEEKLRKWKDQGTEEEQALSYGVLTGAGSYLDFIVPAYRERSCHLVMLEPGDLLQEEKKRQKTEYEKKEELLSWNPAFVKNQEIRLLIEKRFRYRYGFEKESGLYAKISVSEMKRRSRQIEPEDDAMRLIQEEEPILPRFVQENTGIKIEQGCARGTAYHTLLEYMAFSEVFHIKEIDSQKEALVAFGRLTRAEADSIDSFHILTFLKSPLAKRMRKAQDEQKLYKERQFTAGLPAKELYEDSDSDELILLQGIIDAYFEEEEELVLLDYKTDYAKGEDGEEMLVKRYHTQFLLYKKVLEQMTGKRVKEMILYSFSLGKEIMITG